jgi:hypothetical protein
MFFFFYNLNYIPVHTDWDRFFDLFVAMCNHIDDIVDLTYAFVYHFQNHLTLNRNARSPKSV